MTPALRHVVDGAVLLEYPGEPDAEANRAAVAVTEEVNQQGRLRTELLQQVEALVAAPPSMRAHPMAELPTPVVTTSPL